MYIETVKAVHNEYVEIIEQLEDTLHAAYKSGMIPELVGCDTEAAISIMHATIHTTLRVLKISCDNTVEVMEEEMRK